MALNQEANEALDPATIITHWECDKCELTNTLTTPTTAANLAAAPQTGPESHPCQTPSCDHVRCPACFLWEEGAIALPPFWECHKCKVINEYGMVRCRNGACAHELCRECVPLHEDYSRDGGLVISDEEDEDEDEGEGECEKTE